MQRAGSLPARPRSALQASEEGSFAEGTLSGRLPFLSVSDRRCHATNTRGDPCRAAPLRDSQWCSAHDPQLPAAIRFGSREQAAEAATGVQRRTPSVTEQMRERVERESAAILAVYFEALDAGETAELRMRAAERLLDRCFGRPRQAMELAAAAEREGQFVEQMAAQIVEVMTQRRAARPGVAGPPRCAALLPALAA